MDAPADAKAKAIAHLNAHAKAAGVGGAEGASIDVTLVERLGRAHADLGAILQDTRELADKRRPLSQAKRAELEALLATFAEIPSIADSLKAQLAQPTEPTPEKPDQTAARGDVRVQLDMAKRRAHLRELGIA
jgi:hypothetical protein